MLLNKVWHIGAMEMLTRLPDNRVSIITDPPFGVGKTFSVSGEPYWTDPCKNPEQYWEWFQPIYREMVRVCAVGGLIAITQLLGYDEYFPEWFGLKNKATLTIVWNLQRTAYAIVMLRKTRTGLEEVSEGYWRIPDYTADDITGFNAPRPIAEVRKVIRLTPRGSIIVDPFCGSGTTGVAAIRESRPFLLGDLCFSAVRLARKRISEER